jgi:hypothetical protein
MGMMSSVVTLQDLARKKEELASRLGPNLRADGFIEFSQLVEKACALQDTDDAGAQRLSKKAAEILPQVERSVENAFLMRAQIRAKMLEYAREGMQEYHEALKELSK